MTDTAATSLLPCPLCKSDDVGVRHENYRLDAYRAYIVCYDCDLRTGKREYEEEGEVAAVQELAAAWNTRPTPPSEALGEEIRKLARELREKAKKGVYRFEILPTDDRTAIIRLCNAVLGEGK